MKKIIVHLFLLLFLSNFLFAQNELEIGREFGIFTSKNLSGFAKPLVTTLSQSFNSNLWSVGNYNNGWSFGLDISAVGMFIPSSQKTYDAELPGGFGNTNITLTAEKRGQEIIMNQKGTVSQPTLYGGASTPVFSAPQNPFPPDSFYKSVAFVEGNNISFMSGLPSVQLFVGFPTRTQLRFRFFTYPIDDVSTTYFTVALNQNIDKLFNIFKDPFSPYSIALHGAYHNVSRNPGITANSYSFGPSFSAVYPSGIGFYVGAQYENLTGSVKAVRKQSNLDEIVNNPYEEVRLGLPLDVNLETFSNFRILGGVSARFGIVELHGDFAYTSQPQLSAGVSLWLFDTGEQIKLNQDIMTPEKEIIEKPYISYFSEKPIQEINPVVISRLIKPMNIKLEITDVNGAPVNSLLIESYRSRQLRPFLTYIFFDENSAVIPQRYIQFTKDQAHNFSLKDLLGRSSLESYYYVLNILGQRLNEYKNATITITGCNSNLKKEKNNKTLSTQRANVVRDYLVNVWGIEPSRIKTVARNLPEKPSNQKDPDGIAENRRVEISSDTWDVVAPIVIEDTLRFVTPGEVVIKSRVESEYPIKTWELVANSSDENIAYYSGKDTLQNQFNLNFANNEYLKSKLRKDLQTYMRVENPEESALSEMVKVPVNIVRKDSSINIYNLILFDFDRSDLNQTNKRIADFIDSDISNDASVTVVGHTDRIGNDDYNKRLSDARAKTTAEALKNKNVQAYGIGEQDLLYDNTTPEGRFYCRTVQVVVRQKN